MNIKCSVRAKPLYFMHIPKTGGTSLADAILWSYPLNKIFYPNNIVTEDFINANINRIDRDSIIIGHPGPGIGGIIKDIADVVTVLRNPRDRTVSQYLQIRRHYDNPNCCDARLLSLDEFLRRHPEQIAFQALYLDQVVNGESLYDYSEIYGRISRVCDYIFSIKLAGVMERSAEFCAALTGLIGSPCPITLLNLNSSIGHGESSDEIGKLKEQYDRLRRGGEFSSLFEFEEAVYVAACQALDRASAEPFALKAGGDLSGNRGMHLATRLFSSRVGQLVHGRLECPLSQRGEHLVFGPYRRLEKGAYAIDFHIAMDRVTARDFGVLVVEVVAKENCFRAIKFLKRSIAYNKKPVRLVFYNFRSQDDLEFRIYSNFFGQGLLDFGGVDIYKLTNNSDFKKLSIALRTFYSYIFGNSLIWWECLTVKFRQYFFSIGQRRNCSRVGCDAADVEQLRPS